MVAHAEDDFSIAAESAVLMDAETGQFLYKKKENLERPPASITKIMTTLLAMEAVEAEEVSLDDQVEISDLAESMGGSQIWLGSGEVHSFRDLLKAVVISSANDACVAVAEHVGGTEQNCARMMNEKVIELGLEHTHFVNTTGLPVNNGKHYSSAEDIAIMSRELITEYPQVLDWSKKRVDYIKGGDLPIYTTNELLGNFPGADGLKTGWTDEAGYCLSATAQRGDRRLISVVMGTDSEQARVDETAKLLNYGFQAFHEVKLINSGVELEKVKVKKGKELEVPLETASGFSAIIKRGTKDNISQELKIKEEISAPVEKGTEVGRVVFTQEDKNLGEVKLVTSKQVEKANLMVIILRWLRDFIIGLFQK